MSSKDDSSRDGGEPSSVLSPAEPAEGHRAPAPALAVREHEDQCTAAAMRPRDLVPWVRHVQDMQPEEIAKMQAAGQWGKVGACLAGLLQHEDPKVKANAIRLQVAMADAETRRLAVVNEAARIETDRGDSPTGGGTITREVIWREVMKAREGPKDEAV